MCIDSKDLFREFTVRRVLSGGEFNMNKSLITGLIVGGVAVTAVGAYAGYQSMDSRNSADVLNVEPLMRTVKTARQVCSDVIVTTEAPTNDPKRVAGAVMGAVVGGVVGNQVGDDNTQTVATVAGAAAGGYAGSKIQKHMQDGKTTQSVQQQCRTVYDSAQVPDGYEVRYSLDGKEGTVRMDHDPGQRIPVENGQLVLTAAGNRQ